MVSFLFRAPRIEHDLIMSVGLQDMHTGLPIPGRVATTVINFSSQGACLILQNLTINGKHLFYETLNSDNFNLLLYPLEQTDVEVETTIAARSIWMDSCEHKHQPAFKIGIHFLRNQKDLYKLFKKSP